MKTQHPLTKTISMVLLVLALSGQHALAAVQNNLTAETHSDNIAITLCVILFIIGFAVLIALKINDDKKHPQQNQSHGLPNSRNGHRHQHSH